MNEMGPNSSKSGEFFEIACPMTELQIWLRFLKRRPARSLARSYSVLIIGTDGIARLKAGFMEDGFIQGETLAPIDYTVCGADDRRMNNAEFID